ncbi:hypothetical protein [Solibacillus sp. R5-41]|nr:hypothetical protein [Solibacillus sp. R5-41]
MSNMQFYLVGLEPMLNQINAPADVTDFLWEFIKIARKKSGRNYAKA